MSPVLIHFLCVTQDFLDFFGILLQLSLTNLSCLMSLSSLYLLSKKKIQFYFLYFEIERESKAEK